MLKTEVRRDGPLRIVIVDSITQLDAEDEGALVVSGSHGGASAAEFALAVRLAAVFFNDAGVGKDEAGVAALHLLQQRGVAAGTVSHLSARIGDAQDAWDHGVVSRLNEAARALGIAPGERLRDALNRLLQQARTER
ncbi:MAG TPA: hypothetical protein VLD35_13360 [Caldimonas sp.]|nr:hypothetical protein [Caldimonas sp.]